MAKSLKKLVGYKSAIADLRKFFKNSSPQEIQQRIGVPILFMAMGITGAIYFGFNLSKPAEIKPPIAIAIPAPSEVQTPQPQQPKTLPRSEPTRVKITRLGIDGPTVTIGLQADGTLGIPYKAGDIGWYDKAPTPGELGPAILVGHVDWRGSRGVFYRLREVIPGDIVEVDRADGKTIKFTVNTVKQFEQDNFPTQEVYGNIDHAGVRLITCSGVFNKETRRYSHNTVVYGSLVI